MNQDLNNNVDQNNLNMQSNDINQLAKPEKKKKYWLIPIFVFLIMIGSLIIPLVLISAGIDNSIISIFSKLYILCVFAFISSIIIAIVLSIKNK